MAAWMFLDFADIQRDGQVYTYRVKHNFAWLFLPLSGFAIGSGVFLARLGKRAILPALFFVAMGLSVGWTGLAIDTSNHHVRVGPDDVYSEWGSKSRPESVAIDFRDLEQLSLVNETDGDKKIRSLVGHQKSGGTVRMPVNDLVQLALKRIFVNASVHKVRLDLGDASAE